MRCCVVLVDRANYGRLKPVIDRMVSEGIDTQIICGGSMVLERFGAPYRELVAARHRVRLVYHEIEGNRPLSRTLSIGQGVQAYATELSRESCDYVIVIGDRFEALAAAIAAKYSGHKLIHFQGGEVSGTIDDVTRRAISQMADYHVPSTDQAKINIVCEARGKILEVGCPGMDVALKFRGRDVGDKILCIYHPGDNDACYDEYVRFVVRNKDRCVAWWPNIDPGSDGLAKEFRRHGVTALKNCSPEDYCELLSGAACCVGNSSSFIREASFLGVPVVLLGDRQRGRERGPNIIHCDTWTAEQIEACTELWRADRPKPVDLYGDGHVSDRFVRSLLRLFVVGKREFNHLFCRLASFLV